jgi:cyclohexanone monooxygenase
VVANGTEYPVDCLIFATGFEVGTSYTRRAGYDIVGRGGQTLSEHWADGLRTLHGLTTNGFPNCFFLGFTQGAITISVPQALNEQANHVTYLVSQTRARGAEVLEPTAEAQDAYVNEVRSLARLGLRFYMECTPGYYNSEGMSGNKGGFFSDMYGAGPLKFFELLNAWRSTGRMEGIALS